MSLSVRRCAEPMNRVCRLKVNFQGHGIYPLKFPIRSISPEPFERFSINFTQGQGYTSMLWDLPFNFVSAQYLLNPLNDLKLTSPKCPSQ